MLVGIVGKPSVGKSTFFKAATLADAEIANYPFTTIKPNSGVGYVRVPDPATQFGKVSNPRDGFVLGTSRFVPVQLIDVAGLVPGAHEGKGMGNQFLDDLRQADVLIHVIDVSGSTNEKGEAVKAGEYDPAKDITFLEVELDMWYLNILTKGWNKFARQIQQEKQEITKALANQLSGLKVTEELIEQAVTDLNLPVDQPMQWTKDNLLSIESFLRKKTKPMVIACNKVDTEEGRKNLEILKQKFTHYSLIGCSAESELALREAHKHELIEYIPGDNSFKRKGNLSDKQQSALEFIQSQVLGVQGSSGVQNILNEAVFEVSKYMAIFPGGSKLEDKDGNTLPDCFLMPPSSTALDFAYRLHTDLGKRFIRAVDIKTKRTVGKEYALSHTDIIEIIAGK